MGPAFLVFFSLAGQNFKSLHPYFIGFVLILSAYVLNWVLHSVCVQRALACTYLQKAYLQIDVCRFGLYLLLFVNVCAYVHVDCHLWILEEGTRNWNIKTVCHLSVHHRTLSH